MFDWLWNFLSIMPRIRHVFQFECPLRENFPDFLYVIGTRQSHVLFLPHIWIIIFSSYFGWWLLHFITIYMLNQLEATKWKHIWNLLLFFIVFLSSSLLTFLLFYFIFHFFVAFISIFFIIRCSFSKHHVYV